MNANPSPFSISEAPSRWMYEDLAKSGIEPLDIGAVAYIGPGATPWSDVKVDGSAEPVNLSIWVSMYYTIPYWSPEGEPLPHVVVRKPRFKDGAPSEVRARKYARPGKRVVGDLAVVPYMHPGRIDFTSEAVLDIHEGEKKTACAVKHRQCAIGIGGCHSWGDPEKKGRIHPWIKGEVERIQVACPDKRVKVRMWPDADYRTNPAVGQGYSGLASELMMLDVDVVLVDLSGFGPAAKFDDLVVELGYWPLMMRIVEASATTLPENPETLARRYQLLTSPVGTKEEKRLLPQAIFDNYATLLERHPHFLYADGSPLIWLDSDLQRPMFGASELVENKDDAEILRYFQRHLGFNGSGRTITLPAMRDAIAHRLQNNRRSPFKERVRSAAQRIREAGPATMRKANDALDRWALDYLGAPDDAAGFNRRWGRKLLMSVVGRALEPGCFMRTAYVIAGPQDVGKTNFMEALVGKQYIKIVNDANSNGKDLAMTYASCLVAVHDEMQAMTSRGIQSVKSDISATVDNIRPPFGRLNVDMPRRCVFLIPVDRMDFLFEDAAGMTRFAVLNLLESHKKGDRFDFAGMEAAADDLLGAAWIAVESGEVFDVVEGAEESARPHLKTDLNMEQIVDVIESPNFASSILSGAYKGEQITGFKLTSLVAHMPAGYKAAGGGSAVITGPLRKLGFLQESPNKNPLNTRGLWYMEAEKFNAAFAVARRKHDV